MRAAHTNKAQPNSTPSAPQDLRASEQAPHREGHKTQREENHPWRNEVNPQGTLKRRRTAAGRMRSTLRGIFRKRRSRMRSALTNRAQPSSTPRMPQEQAQHRVRTQHTLKTDTRGEPWGPRRTGDRPGSLERPVLRPGGPGSTVL